MGNFTRHDHFSSSLAMPFVSMHCDYCVVYPTSWSWAMLHGASLSGGWACTRFSSVNCCPPAAGPRWCGMWRSVASYETHQGACPRRCSGWRQHLRLFLLFLQQERCVLELKACLVCLQIVCDLLFLPWRISFPYNCRTGWSSSLHLCCACVCKEHIVDDGARDWATYKLR